MVGRGEIEIAAAPELVWDVLTAIDRWPSWNPQVKSMDMQGGLAEGTQFRWKAGPGTITSTIRSVEAPRLIAWTGKTLSINAIHEYRLEPRDGKTSVRTEESYEGLDRAPLSTIAPEDARHGARGRTSAPQSRGRTADD